MSPRRSLLVVGALLGSSALAGCSYNSPQTTATPYSASDGVLGDVSDIAVRNMMLVAAAKDKPGQLYGSLVNSGSSARKVTITSESGSFPSVTVPAGQTVNLTGKKLRIPKTSVMPGESLDVTLATAGASTKLAVPVLDGTLPEYRTLVPSAASSSTKAGSTARSSANTSTAGTATSKAASGRATTSTAASTR